MKKAVIYYRSKSGTTKYFAGAVSKYLETQNIKSECFSVFDYSENQLADTDVVLLGCWTHGLFIAFQHPDKEWVEFAQKLPNLKNKKIALFTTYKLATGSMFKKMEKQLKGKIDSISITLKSKSEKLTPEHEKVISEFVKS
ncbi:MAG: flavodoxin domain-containing protein [Bacteroidales bacterium]|nr:flavodoxin domain-containing protein [Bacteroidales bacterium]MBN2818731.1 flavodoxin domain-containing protein [Bacteroidales bacterium]